MDQNFVFLTEKEEMWAKMLVDVLQDHGIPCTALPVNGIGFSIHTGLQDCLKIFVPKEKFTRASELLEELFSSENVVEAE